MEHIADWLTKQQAADALSVSFRTLDKFVADGKLQSSKRNQPGKPPATVYHPGDVEQIRKERQPPAHALPAVRADTSRSLAQTAQSHPVDSLAAFTELLRAMTNSDEKRLFLTLKEAAHLSGLTQTYLQRAIDDETLPVIRDGRRIRIRRKDVEGL